MTRTAVASGNRPNPHGAISRPIVGLAPLGAARCGGAIGPALRIPIGFTRLPAGLVVIAKLTFAYGDGEQAWLAEQQQAFSLGERARHDGSAPGDLTAPNDFAVFKPQTDVLLTGSAYAATALARIPARLSVDTVRREFTTVGPSPIERMPLASEYLRGPTGAAATAPVGAIGPVAVKLDEEEQPQEQEDEQFTHEPPGILTIGSEQSDDDFVELVDGDEPDTTDAALCKQWWLLTTPDLVDRQTPQSYASKPQRSKLGTYVAANAAIELTGLSRGGATTNVRLPGIAPLCMAQTRHDDLWVGMALDTLSIDSDEQRITAVWRGQVPLLSPWDLQRLIVSVESATDPRPLGVVLRDLPRGHYFRAVDEHDVRAGTFDLNDADPELELARQREWSLRPEPTLTLEDYATINAELTAKQHSRGKVLANHGLSEDRWMLEDRAWLERLGDSVMRSDGALSRRHGALLSAKRQALAAQTDGQPRGES